MKKLIFSIAACLLLAACASNPSIDLNTSVSRNTLAGIANSYGIALAGEQQYKNYCITSGDTKCRAIVQTLQTYDKKAVDALVAANNFIKANPTVNAGNIIQIAQNAVSAFQNYVNQTK